jgi:hypothetical protein
MNSFERLQNKLFKELGINPDDDLLAAIVSNKKTEVLNSIEVPDMGCKLNWYYFKGIHIISTFLPEVLPVGVDCDGAGGGELLFLTKYEDEAIEIFNEDASKIEKLTGVEY